MVVSVEASVSADPSRRPPRRDATACLVVVDAGALHLLRRDGRPLLHVPLDRVDLQALPGSWPPALALGVDRSLMRLDLRLPCPSPRGVRGLSRRLLGAAANARAVVRRRRLLRAAR